MNNEYADLVESLRYLRWAYVGHLDHLDSATISEAVNAIEYLSAELEKKESGGWIKCSERMPDTAKVWGCVKFHDEKGNTFYQEEVIFYDGDGIFTNYGNVPVPVVAWHPLPEPYKESEEDTK